MIVEKISQYEVNGDKTSYRKIPSRFRCLFSINVHKSLTRYGTESPSRAHNSAKGIPKIYKIKGLLENFHEKQHNKEHVIPCIT